MRPEAKALRSVRTMASWPISSAKTLGRYLRASAAWLSGAAGGAETSAFPLAGRFGALFWFSASAIDGRNFHAKGLQTGRQPGRDAACTWGEVGGWTNNPRNAR